MIGRDDLRSSITPFCCLVLHFIDDGMDEEELSTVENLLITMFSGSTNLAIQVSSGAKIIDLGLKS